MEYCDILEFKYFPFLVPEWRRGRLARYKAAAMACEEQLERERRAQLQLLRARVAQRTAQLEVKHTPAPVVNTPSVTKHNERGSPSVNRGRSHKVKHRRSVADHTRSNSHSSNLNAHFCAVARGFLTRRLLASEKVQHLVQTIRDASAVLDTMGSSTNADSALKHRLCAQLHVARQMLYEIFFHLPVEERMSYIAHARLLRQERSFRGNESQPTEQRTRGRLSAATLKSLQRRQQQSGGGLATTAVGLATTTSGLATTGKSASGKKSKLPSRKYTAAVANKHTS